MEQNQKPNQEQAEQTKQRKPDEETEQILNAMKAILKNRKGFLALVDKDEKGVNVLQNASDEILTDIVYSILNRHPKIASKILKDVLDAMAESGAHMMAISKDMTSKDIADAIDSMRSGKGDRVLN